MLQDNSVILALPAELNTGHNLLRLSKSKCHSFTDKDTISDISFEGFLFKDGTSDMAGCKGKLDNTGNGYMKLVIASTSTPSSAIDLFYHSTSGECRIETNGIPFDNLDKIVLKLYRNGPPKGRRNTDGLDDGFDTTASAAQFKTNLDNHYGRRTTHLTAENALDKAMVSARSLLVLAKECQDGTLGDVSSNFIKINQEMAVLLTQLRDTAIARSSDPSSLLAKLWDMTQDRINTIRNRGKDNS